MRKVSPRDTDSGVYVLGAKDYTRRTVSRPHAIHRLRKQCFAHVDTSVKQGPKSYVCICRPETNHSVAVLHQRHVANLDSKREYKPRIANLKMRPGPAIDNGDGGIQRIALPPHRIDAYDYSGDQQHHGHQCPQHYLHHRACHASSWHRRRLYIRIGLQCRTWLHICSTIRRGIVFSVHGQTHAPYLLQR